MKTKNKTCRMSHTDSGTPFPAAASPAACSGPRYISSFGGSVILLCFLFLSDEAAKRPLAQNTALCTCISNLHACPILSGCFFFQLLHNFKSPTSVEYLSRCGGVQARLCLYYLHAPYSHSFLQICPISVLICPDTTIL